MGSQNWEAYIDTLLEELLLAVSSTKTRHETKGARNPKPFHEPTGRSTHQLLTREQSIEECILQKYEPLESSPRQLHLIRQQRTGNLSGAYLKNSPQSSWETSVGSQSSHIFLKSLVQPLSSTTLDLMHSNSSRCCGCNRTNSLPSDLLLPSRPGARTYAFSTDSSLDEIINRYLSSKNLSGTFKNSLTSLTNTSKRNPLMTCTSSSCGQCFSYRLDRYLLVNRHDSVCHASSSPYF